MSTQPVRRSRQRLALVLLYGGLSISPAATLMAFGIAAFRVHSELITRGHSEEAMHCAEWLSYAVLGSVFCGYALALRFVLDVRRDSTVKADARAGWTFLLVFVPILALPAYWWRWAKRQR